MENLIKNSINIITPLSKKNEDLIYTWIMDAIVYLPYMRKQDYI